MAVSALGRRLCGRRWLLFDPVRWRGRFHDSPSGQAALFADFNALAKSHQNKVAHAADPPLRANLELSRLLQNPLLSVFGLAVLLLRANIAHPLLVEKLVSLLLDKDRLQAAVALIHLLLGSDSEKYAFSTQLWSHLALKAVEYCDHPAACLVYSEVLEPHEACLSSEEPVPQFLLMPELVLQLAIVFSAHGDSSAVLGLKRYFKRYFSYLHHRETYRALLVAEVEAHAEAGHFAEAVSAYKKLAWLHRGHGVVKNRDSTEHNLRYAVHVTLKQREEHIRLGTSEIPSHNRYSLPGGRFNAMFDGTLRITDTPVLTGLIQRSVDSLMAQRNRLDRLASFVASTDHTLLKHVIWALCRSNYASEAWGLMNRLPVLFPRLRLQLLVRGDEVFVALFLALHRVGGSDHSRDFSARDLVTKCRRFADSAAKDAWSTHSRTACLQSMLTVGVSRSELERFISEWRDLAENRWFVIYLDQRSFERLAEYDLAPFFLGPIELN